MTWRRDPLDDVDGRFSEGFDLVGLVPSGYTLFAAVLVVALGVVLRRTAAAVARSGRSSFLDRGPAFADIC